MADQAPAPRKTPAQRRAQAEAKSKQERAEQERAEQEEAEEAQRAKEERRARQERRADEALEESRRGVKVSKAATAIALVALLVSGVGVALPMITEKVAHDAMITDYLTALVGPLKSSPTKARGYAAQESKADWYAATVGFIWQSLSDSAADLSAMGESSVSDEVDGEREACFPDVHLFPQRCAGYGGFEFSTEGKITRFTVDGIPVEAAFSQSNFVNSATNEQPNQMQVYYAGILIGTADQDTADRTVILSMNRQPSVTTGRTAVTLSSVTAAAGTLDEAGSINSSTVVASSFPPSLSYYDTYVAAVRVKADARYLNLCWDGTPEHDASSCDWVYRVHP